MGSYSLIQLRTWVYSEYGVNPDLKIHTGRCILFEYGVVHFNYRNKKTDTKISTEVELVGMSDNLLYNIWICLLMGDQG